MKRDWIEEYENYLDFLSSGAESLNPKTQEEAKELLINEIEAIIAMNGEAELYSFERELCKELNIKLEEVYDGC